MDHKDRISDVAKTVFNFSKSRTGNVFDAEDLSQEILLELCRSIGDLRSENAFYGFMWSVANNVCKRWYAKKSRQSHVTELDFDLPDADCEQSREEDETIALLRREIGLLSEKYRRAVILYYVENKSCSEISSLLGTSESMVKYLLFKSRMILKEGMSMERNFGSLSYNPKTLIPLYSGEGPNYFWKFMQSKIKQNIVSACYNDSLTEQQISLETGIALPYLDDEIKALEDKKIIIKDGKHFKANVIVITADCADEIGRAVTEYPGQIADKGEAYVTEKLDEYRKIGFSGNDFSENTLRWQLCTILFRTIMIASYGGSVTNFPKTGWGERAYIWCVEKPIEKHVFSFADVNSNRDDRLYFFNYEKNGKGDHRDFYRNKRYISIFCDICRGEKTDFSEYDLEAIAEMIKKGYVIGEKGSYRAAVPVYSSEQYAEIVRKTKEFTDNELGGIIRELEATTVRILSAHTPKHLSDQIPGIAMNDAFVNTVCIPATILIERQFLSTSWHPFEMPTTYTVLR